MKEYLKTTAVFRIKALERGIKIRNHENNGDGKILTCNDSWVEATGHALFGWIVLPTYANYGLPLQVWQTLWDELKVEFQVQEADGSWQDFFEQ